MRLASWDGFLFDNSSTSVSRSRSARSDDCFSVSSSDLRRQLVEVFRQRLGSVSELADGLVAGSHSVDAYLGPAHGGLKGAKALVHAIEFLLLDRPPLEMPTNRISQGRGLLLQTP